MPAADDYHWKNMSTALYKSIIYGPVRSRRLGVSLGVNLLPDDGKACTFDCIYCECGLNRDNIPSHPHPTRSQVADSLERVLADMSCRGSRLDDISFAGNGEPTSHPDFTLIVDDTIRLRDRYFPSATVSVMSNATFIHREAVREALMRLDNNILKLDTVDSNYIRTVDRPTGKRYDVGRIIDCMKLFHGRLTIQTMFLHGSVDGIDVSNTDNCHVREWLDAVREITPRSVMIYTIDRSTPVPGLSKASPAELDAIRDMVAAAGFECIVAY